MQPAEVKKNPILQADSLCGIIIPESVVLLPQFKLLMRYSRATPFRNCLYFIRFKTLEGA